MSQTTQAQANRELESNLNQTVDWSFMSELVKWRCVGTHSSTAIYTLDFTHMA